MTIKTFFLAGLLSVSAMAAMAADHVVEIKGFAFSPANLTIAAGDTVTFINKDGAPHTATDKAGGFDTGRLGRNKGAKITFSNAGTFAYFCEIHPRMTGSITVK